MFKRADLHIHSTASDGDLSPEKVILLSKKRAVDTIAITDHNTIAGIDEASKAGKEHGISVIPAVELSTRYKSESVHILGYFKDRRYNNEVFKQILRLVKSHKVIEARKIYGGYRNKQTYANYLSTSEGISLLRAFGAAVVLAHPVRISSNILPDLLNLPFDGLEAKYCRSSEYQTNFFIKTALNRFSFYTAGSDFHSEKKDYKHSLIGIPFLSSQETLRFLDKSGALVLGTTNEEKLLSRYKTYY